MIRLSAMVGNQGERASFAAPHLHGAWSQPRHTALGASFASRFHQDFASIEALCDRFSGLGGGVGAQSRLVLTSLATVELAAHCRGNGRGRPSTAGVSECSSAWCIDTSHYGRFPV